MYDRKMTFVDPYLVLVCALMWGCAPAVPTPSARSAQPQPEPQPSASRPAHASTPSGASPAVNVEATDARPCGGHGCLAFATVEAAFAFVLAADPRVLAIGEAHAQRGTTGIRSSTRRFAEQLLPMLQGKAKHIVIELLVANCTQETVKEVEHAQRPVSETQAPTNQNEFLTLGKYAQRYGIEPQALVPDCAAYHAAASSGDDAVPKLLQLIAEQTRVSVMALLNAPSAEHEMILSYGGALHNDLEPRAGQESWSFGPALSDASHGRYVELDLIVPEFVKDTEAWTQLPWFDAFDRQHLASEALLYRPRANSFALIFPKSELPATEGR